MLRGPANRPSYVLPGVLATLLVIGYVARGRWLVLTTIAVALILGQVWSRYAPSRPAGRVRRHWPWHDD